MLYSSTQQALMKPTDTKCPNCDTPLQGKFCHECGEKRPSRKDFALSHFLKEAFEKFTHLDSKLLRSLWLLITKPGFLSVEYLRGKRKTYEKPLALFLIVNLIYFFTISWNNLRTYESPLTTQLRNPYQRLVRQMIQVRFGDNTAALNAFAPLFDAQMHLLSKSLLLLMVPMYAAIFAVLYRKRNRYFGEHLVAAFHFHALMLASNVLIGVVMRGTLIGYLLPPVGWEHFILEIVEPLLISTVLALLSFRTVYPDTWPRTLLKAITLSLLWMPCLILYRLIVFLITWHSV